MQKIVLVLFSLLVISLNSCLTYQTVEYIIDFTDNFDSGKISVVYTDIRSSEAEEEKQKADFDELIELYQDDMFLLDQIGDGVYIRERKLYEKDGMIVGSYSGIFQKIKIDNHVMDLRNDERFIMLDLGENSKIETNGKVLRSDNNVLLVWPEDQKHLKIKKIIAEDEIESYSILDYYHNWVN